MRFFGVSGVTVSDPGCGASGESQAKSESSGVDTAVGRYISVLGERKRRTLTRRESKYRSEETYRCAGSDTDETVWACHYRW